MARFAVSFAWAPRLAMTILAVAHGPGCSLLEPYDHGPQAKVEGNWVVGTIEDERGNPLAGVRVASGTGSTTTAATGRFELAGNVGTSLLTATKTGFAAAYVHAQVQADAVTTISMTLTRVTVAMTVDLSGGPVTVEAGPNMKIELSADALQTPAGTAPTGPVDVELTYVDPTLAAQTSPVPLEAFDGEEIVPLISYGMFDVTLSSGGQRLDIAANRFLPVTLAARPGDPETSNIFSVDEASGAWKLEGTVTRGASEWVVNIPHLSWWNVDGFSKVPRDERCCINFRALDGLQRGIAGVRVSGTWQDGRIRVAGNTDVDGMLCHASFQCDQRLEVEYAHFISPQSTTFIERQLTVFPSARGASCDSAQCETVDLFVPCTLDSDCPANSTCVVDVCRPDVGVDESDADSDSGVSHEDAGDPTGQGGFAGSCRLFFEDDPGICVNYFGITVDQLMQECMVAGEDIDALNDDFYPVYDRQPCPTALSQGVCLVDVAQDGQRITGQIIPYYFPAQELSEFELDCNDFWGGRWEAQYDGI